MLNLANTFTLAMTINGWITEIGRSLGLLTARLWLAWIFFKAGLVKLSNWDSTLYLFTEEYNVPLLPPAFAAFMGTVAELVLPVLLALGLATRLNALALFVFNAVAVYSYWHVLAGTPGLQDHVIWSILMLILMLQGGGKASLDSLACYLVRKR